MNEKLPKQDKESGGTTVPDLVVEGSPTKAEENEKRPRAVEKTPLDKSETHTDNESERKQILEEIKASISQTSKEAPGTVSAATAAKILQLSSAGKKKEGNRIMSGVAKLGRGFGKGLKFLGKLLGFGVTVVFAGVGSLMGGLFKMGSGKGGGKDSGHKKTPSKSHAAPKGDGGGHAAKEKSHSASAHHH